MKRRARAARQKSAAGEKPERQHRLALTLLFTGLVLCFMLVTLLIVGVVVYLLVYLEILTGSDHSVPTAAQIIIVFGLSALVLGAGITFFFGKIPMKAVNRLINQMNRLAAGDFHARLDYGGFWGRYPTVKELSSSFNRMAAELESTELLRSDFINNFSHEFKTPIVSIVGFTKLLRRGNLPEAQKQEYLRIMEDEALRLSRMATNVLDLTRVENQTILSDVTQFNLSEQIRACILLLSEAWEKKELEFGLDFGEYTICASEELLRQVWLNILENAIKFTPRCGFIEVKITQEEDTISVCIMNTGSEIAPEQQKKIFRKFYQADESHAAEGNGLGLAIVKRITELHEGEVSVHCAPGATSFTVTLPRRTL